MKICTIFTGGTIGSRVRKNGVISTERGAAYRLIENYTSLYGKNDEFLVEEPYTILSENLDAGHLKRLISCIDKWVRKKDIDGIIVTHGTDTLQYTAAILSYIFGGSEIPIILVSSDLPLEDTSSNGMDNFRYAVKFIELGCGKGVFVSYRNRGEFPVIHRGTRLQYSEQYSARLDSISDSWFGRFEEDVFVKNPAYIVRPGMEKLLDSVDCVELSDKSDKIMRIQPYVGMEYPDIPNDVKVVLHESFHSGTISISAGLERFAAQAKNKGVRIFLTGLAAKKSVYETVEMYRSMGIISLPESAVISQYCKLWLAVSNNLDIDEIMKISVVEDHVKG